MRYCFFFFIRRSVLEIMEYTINKNEISVCVFEEEGDNELNSFCKKNNRVPCGLRNKIRKIARNERALKNDVFL